MALTCGFQAIIAGASCMEKSGGCAMNPSNPRLFIASAAAALLPAKARTQTGPAMRRAAVVPIRNSAICCGAMSLTSRDLISRLPLELSIEDFPTNASVPICPAVWMRPEVNRSAMRRRAICVTFAAGAIWPSFTAAFPSNHPPPGPDPGRVRCCGSGACIRCALIICLKEKTDGHIAPDRCLRAKAPPTGFTGQVRIYTRRTPPRPTACRARV